MVEQRETSSTYDLKKALTELLGDERTAAYYQRIFCYLGSRTTGGGRFTFEKDREEKTRIVGIGFGPRDLGKETIIQIKKDSFWLRERNKKCCFVRSPLVLPQHLPQFGMEFALESRGGSRIFLGLIREIHNGSEINSRVIIIEQSLP